MKFFCMATAIITGLLFSSGHLVIIFLLTTTACLFLEHFFDGHNN
jgi:hypothetical protein